MKQNFISKLSDQQYSALIHLSLLFGFLHFLIPIILVLFLWLNKRKQSHYIDSHGVSVLNWMISITVISTIFQFSLPFLTYMVFNDHYAHNLKLFLIIIQFVIFSIIIYGAHKAYTNNFFEYPLSIKIIKELT